MHVFGWGVDGENWPPPEKGQSHLACGLTWGRGESRRENTPPQKKLGLGSFLAHGPLGLGGECFSGELTWRLPLSLAWNSTAS